MTSIIFGHNQNLDWSDGDLVNTHKNPITNNLVLITYTIGTHSIIIDLNSGGVSNTLSWASIEDPNTSPTSEINTIQYAIPRTSSIRGSDTPPDIQEFNTFYDDDEIEHSYWKEWGTTSPSSWEEISNGGTITTTTYRYIEIRETLRSN